MGLGQSNTQTEYRYGIALSMVLSAALALFYADRSGWLWLLAGVLQAGAVFAVYATTTLAPRLAGGAALLAAAVFGALIASLALGYGDTRVATGILGVLLALGLGVTVMRALAIQPVVDGRTILGAITVYVVLGLLFAELYWVAGAWSGGDFFEGAGDLVIGDVVYFSYVTLTTVGYGDLSPATELGRALAVLEAMIGQLYLVTVLALIVGNLGTRRSSA